MSGGHAERTRRMLYGRRKGPKLSAHQQHLLDDLLPQFQLHLNEGDDPRSYFSPPRTRGKPAPHLLRGRNAERGEGISSGGQVGDVWLEVGFGGGEHLIWQAQNHPNIGIIGAEPYVNGVVKLLSKLDSLSPAGGQGQGEGVSKRARDSTAPSPRPSPPHAWGRGRILVYTGDARDIVEALPDTSVGRVFVLFPDPWPKTRHHKRRFIQMAMLDELARVMKPGAELRFASDDDGYVEWTLERLIAYPAFEWTVSCAADWQIRPADWPPTRYEAKQLHGRPAFLKFRRR